MLIPKRSTKEIKKIRDSFPLKDPRWLLYNSELRFTAAYNSNPKSSDTMAWRHIYKHNLRLYKETSNPVKHVWNILPLPKPTNGLDQITSAILLNRGITDPDFIEASLENINPDMEGLNEAANLIFRAISKKVPITIYGDYDADGITGTALLVESLSTLGAKVDYYINNRYNGYAVNEQGIREIASRGTPRLIITVDNGVSAYEAINLARKMKMAIIVTDHHEISELPNPNVLIHPKNFNTPLAGVGVAFKLVCKLYERANRTDAFDLLDLVAIGTIADVVPLIGENRIFAKHGIMYSNINPRPAITALSGRINSETIACKIAPIINALSRMNGTADQAVEFLIEKNIKKAQETAKYLIALNNKRKEQVKIDLQRAEKLIDPDDKIIIVKYEIHEGITGLIAGKIAEKYNRPAVVLSENGQYLKGSCRSVKNFNIIKALRNCNLVSCGGHPMAAGVTLEKSMFPMFCRTLLDQAKGLYFHPPTYNIDAELDTIDLDLIRKIESLEPFGESFPAPLFLTRCSVKNAKEIGNNHFKAIDNGVEYIIWDAFKDINCKELKLIGRPSLNEFNGSSKVQFIARDYRSIA